MCVSLSVRLLGFLYEKRILFQDNVTIVGINHFPCASEIRAKHYEHYEMVRSARVLNLRSWLNACIHSSWCSSLSVRLLPSFLNVFSFCFSFWLINIFCVSDLKLVVSSFILINFSQCTLVAFCVPAAAAVTTADRHIQTFNIQHPPSQSASQSQSQSVSPSQLSGQHCKFLHGRSTENCLCSF